MGHRKNRKRQRRGEEWAPAEVERPGTRRGVSGYPSDSDFLVLLGAGGATDTIAPIRSCGGCREFTEAQEGGRGTCLHPGSGVLSPWTDTEVCAFFQPVQGSQARLRRN